jgi:hypothetical protein
MPVGFSRAMRMVGRAGRATRSEIGSPSSIRMRSARKLFGRLIAVLFLLLEAAQDQLIERFGDLGVEFARGDRNLVFVLIGYR